MKVVTIGGGSGQHGVLLGLVEYSKRNKNLKQEEITAIVSTFDTGGHTKVLLDARRPKDTKGNFLPPGDIRQCLAAMANNQDAKKLFQYRIRDGDNKGAVIGNILLDAGYEQHGSDFEKAIELAKKFLDVRGNVLPCTLVRAQFYGVLENGYSVMGEEELIEKAIWCDSRIKKIALKPSNVHANAKAVNAIKEADKIIFSQGSIYTSLLPNILIKEIADSIRKSKAQKVYIMNIVTQRGETDGFTAQDHLNLVEEYLGKDVIDKIIIHDGKLPQQLIEKYEKEGQEQVVDNLVDKRVVHANLIANDSPVLRHDPEKLAETIIKL